MSESDPSVQDEAAPAPTRPDRSDPRWSRVLMRHLVNVHEITLEGEDIVAVQGGGNIELPLEFSRKAFGTHVRRYRTREADAIRRTWEALPAECVMLDPTGPELVVWTGEGFERHVLWDVDEFDTQLDRTGTPDAGHLRLPAGTTIWPEEGGFLLPSGEYLRLYASGIVRVARRDGRPPRDLGDVTPPQHLAWRIRVGGNPHGYGAEGGAHEVRTVHDTEVVLPRVLLELTEYHAVEVCRTIARLVETDAPHVIDLAEEVDFDR